MTEKNRENPVAYAVEQAVKISGLTQDEFAVHMRVSRLLVSQLINDKAGVTPNVAIRLSAATGSSVDFWLNLQRRQDIRRARQQYSREYAKIKKLPAFDGDGVFEVDVAISALET